jgi:hypothetical protein
LNCVISIAEHEIEMAHRWMDWVCELGGTDGHKLYLIPSSGVDISALIPKSNKAFGGGVNFIKDEEGQTSDWQSSELVRSAAGPNSAFRQVAWYFHHAELGPYFWCELDCIPLRKDWLNRLESEYKSCGKPFMGAHVLIEGVREHMSGNAIYLDPVMNAPTITMRANWTAAGQPIPKELAFDVAGAIEVIPKAHWTNLIQHKFRFKGFESRAEFDAVIDPNAVVFHSDKSGSIYKYLRENLSGGVKSLTETRSQSSERELVGAGGVSDEPIPADRAPSTQSNLSGNVGVAYRHGGDDEAGEGSPSAQDNLPVPVLAEPSCAPESCEGGEARESNRESIKQSDTFTARSDSRGGQTPLTSSETTVVTKTFTPSDEIKFTPLPEPESCPYCGSKKGEKKYCPYCRVWKDPNYKSDELEAVIKQNSVIKNGLPAMSPPWENREDSERDVKMLCDALKLFCGAPIYKSRVRQALREAKIIK